MAGAAGRMGETVCAAVEGADDMELTGRADPQLGTSVADVLGEADVLVDFTQPDTALGNAREAVDTETPASAAICPIVREQSPCRRLISDATTARTAALIRPSTANARTASAAPQLSP